jgi:hypothetical protein
MGWGQVGRELAANLQDLTDEESIRALAIATIKDIAKEETPDARTNALRMLNREILKKFPRKEAKEQNYWHDPKGRESQPKWRHLIFKYLTLEASDWDKTGSETRQAAREDWKATAPADDSKPKETLKDMTIEQLNLDPETQQTLEDALNQSGLPLDEFIQQAIKVYAKTLTGKARKYSEGISAVPTAELLNDPKYSTHPSRAEELTKRAIKAIKFYNSNIATESADRWCITQSAIGSLTGSRASTIKKAMEAFADDIESHNQTYGLGNYSNRKRGKPGIEETINLAEIVPDGLD